MRNICNAVLQKMLRAHLSSLEVDFLLTIARYQNPDGRVTGVYYRDIMEATGCSRQQFYNILRSLSRKEIISYTKADYSDYDITIKGNSLEEEENRKQGYISLAKGMYCKEFQKLRAGAKLLAMELLRRQDIQFRKIQKPSLYYKKETFYKTFCEMLGVTKRVLQGYLQDLRVFFSIGVKEGKFYITPLKRSYEEPIGESGAHILREHEVYVCCRRNRIDTAGYSPYAVKDVTDIMWQHIRTAPEKGMDPMKLVLYVIQETVKKGGGYRASGRRLEPLLIHKLVQMIIASGIVPEGCGV